MISRTTCIVFFNDTATTEIYTLSLHDALPIYRPRGRLDAEAMTRRTAPAILFALALAFLSLAVAEAVSQKREDDLDRKSTRLNSSHANISYAVFCLKKKYIVCCSLLESKQHIT